jgi:hypothetical protein
MGCSHSRDVVSEPPGVAKDGVDGAPANPPPEASPSNCKDVMISYSHADMSFCRWLVKQLRDAGFSVWMDEEALVSGTPSLEAIAQAVCSAAVIVPILSVKRGESQWCTDELGLAYSNQKRLFPVLIDGFSDVQSALSFSDRLILNGVQWENFTGDDRDERAQALIDNIQRAIGRGDAASRVGSEVLTSPFWARHFGDEEEEVLWGRFGAAFKSDVDALGGLPGELHQATLALPLTLPLTVDLPLALPLGLTLSARRAAPGDAGAR